MACFSAELGLVAGHPVFEVALAAAGQGQILVREPVQEIDSGPEMHTCDVELGVSDVVAAASAAKPADQVPGRVAVQDLSPLGGGVGGDEVLHVPFEADHLLVAGRKGAGCHEDGADVFDDFAVGEFVQGLVGQGTSAGGQVGQDGGDDAFREPAHGRRRPLGVGQGVVEGLQLGRDGAGVVSEEVVEPLLERAAAAGAGCGQPFGLTAGRAGAPEFGGRLRAWAADGDVDGAGVDVPEASADGAVHLSLVAPAAAGLPGQLREHAGPRPAADRADQRGQGAAVGADRPVGSPGADHAPLAADDAGLQVGGVHDQALRTQRSTLGIARGGLAPGAAA